MGVKIIHRPEKYAPKVKAALKPVMPQIAQYLRSCADRKIRDGVQPPNSPLTQEVKQGSNTLRDTGTLAASIAAHHGDEWADASTNAKQAHILQNGGTIKSKGKGLWLPAGARTRQLYRQYGAATPGRLIEAMRADGYGIFRKPSSNVYLAQKGKRGKPFPLFIKKGSVKIPARPFLYITGAEEKYIVNKIRQAVMTKMGGDQN